MNAYGPVEMYMCIKAAWGRVWLKKGRRLRGLTKGAVENA